MCSLAFLKINPLIFWSGSNGFLEVVFRNLEAIFFLKLVETTDPLLGPAQVSIGWHFASEGQNSTLRPHQHCHFLNAHSVKSHKAWLCMWRPEIASYYPISLSHNNHKLFSSGGIFEVSSTVLLWLAVSWINCLLQNLLFWLLVYPGVSDNLVYQLPKQ